MGSDLSSNLPEDWATVDMLAQYTYCPRRFHLMYVEGRWEDNAYTLDGKSVHRRVDRIDQILPESEAQPATIEAEAPHPPGDDPPEIARSVSLAAEDLGLMGKLDLVAADPEGGEAVPVETKRGKVPNTPELSYPPERVQLMAQGLLLRRHNYTCDHGYLYFAASRQRVRIDFIPELEQLTLETIAAVRAGRASTTLPPPLEDSPKCWGCSLCGICLPDESAALRHRDSPPLPPPSAKNAEPDLFSQPSHHGADPRRLFPAREHATPLYVQEQGARVGKNGKVLQIKKEGETLGEARLKDISQLVLMGNIGLSAQTLHLLLDEEIPVIHLTTGGWFHGISHGFGLHNSYNRVSQYEAARSSVRCADFARELIRAKAANQRALLMRNSRAEGGQAVRSIAHSLRDGPPGGNGLDQLRGWEGQVAAQYFSEFATMLKTAELGSFHFAHRNRRPPRDPVNALLSFCYTLLAKECAVALLGEGLDPWWGLYHQPRHGRPALALDLMEPYRPIIADSVVLTSINTGMVQARHFITNANGCALQPAGRKRLLQAWEARLDQLFTHPHFDYRCSWRTNLKIQARLLARWLRGDIPSWTCPVVR